MNALLVEGLSDALGFLGGVLVAYWIGLLVGFNPLAEGYGGSAIGSLLLVGVGGFIGLQLARRWRASRKKT